MNSQNPSSSRGNEAQIIDSQIDERREKIPEPTHVGCYEQIVNRKP